MAEDPMDPPPPNPSGGIKKKKTRDLPNLSGCHGCKRRINSSNRKDCLRALKSEWRIVLLCRQCYELVESARLCSYCLTDVATPSPADANPRLTVYHCRRCNRWVHNDCFSRYSDLPPFSYLPGTTGASGNRDFSVCIDCWLPRLLENRLGGTVDKANKRGKVGSDSPSPSPLGRISDCGEEAPPSRLSPEDVANKANCVAKKKLLVAAEAKNKALRKAEAAKKAVELANGAIDLISERGLQNGNDEDAVHCDGDFTLTNYNDEQLAFQLHRAMNSSPRITRNLRLSGEVCIKSDRVSKLKYPLSLGTVVSGQSELETNSREQQYAIHASSSESMDVDCENPTNVNADNHSYQKKCEGDNQLIQTGRCGSGSDRYSRKYRRRSSAITPKDDMVHRSCNLKC